MGTGPFFFDMKDNGVVESDVLSGFSLKYHKIISRI